MRHIPFLILLFSPLYIIAQPVQWASQVLEVSSERKQDPVGEGYKAIQALGAPDKMPVIGPSPCAWSPATPSRRADEWIKVGFNRPQKVQQVIIAENWGAGTITRIILYAKNSDSLTVYEDYANFPPEAKGRLFHIPIKSPSFAVAAAKVFISTLDIEGYNQIDAIGIADHRKEIKLEVQTTNIEVGGEEELLPYPINSPYDEVLPIATPDGSGLFFVRKNHPYNVDGRIKANDDIWYVEAKGDDWGEVKHFDPPLNDKRHNYVSSVTPDGNMLLLGNIYSQNSNNNMSGVSFSERTVKGWGDPQTLPIDNHYNWSKSEEFCLSSNRKVLIFTVQRRDSEGKKDLYVSFKRENGTWTEPMHTGNTINSPADEISPFLAADGRTLYFGSKGFRGFGDFDLFMSKRLDSTWTKWTEPQNLGKPFNSSKADVSLSIDAFGKYAYFSSAKLSLSNNNDIFRVPLPKALRPEPIVLISGKVYNQADSLPISAEIRYEQLSTGQALGAAQSDPVTGKYSITLPLREAYGFFASAPNFLSVDDNIDLSTSQEEETYEIERDLYLVPLVVGQLIRLNNVFFPQSEALLLPSSFPELRRLVQTLQAHPKMKIALEGHTDIEGEPSKNMQLSEDRVQVVKEFLVGEGVEEKRIKTKAYGSTQPLSRDRSPAAKKANRRVEVRILKN